MENIPLKSLKNAERPEDEEEARGSFEEVVAALGSEATEGGNVLNCFLGVKRNVLHILDKSSLGHCLNQSHYVWNISTRAVVGYRNVPQLLNNEVKSIGLGPLGDGLEKIPLKLRHPRVITLSRGQGLPYDLVE
jgi:hypothetical protein